MEDEHLQGLKRLFEETPKRITGNSEFINPRAISNAQGKDLRELVELLEISSEKDAEHGEEQKSKEQVTGFSRENGFELKKM